ncbi:MAG: hypothetical protein JWR51_4603 [Devosia sp.]|nr:hypothetical protein [Devosia sp.]
MGPEGWAILLTKILDARDGNGPERYPVDVVKLALEYSAQRFPETPIKRVDADDLDGFEGALVPGEKRPTAWGILYNNNQRPERARFTVAHELGHYLLHREEYPDGFWCGEDVVSRREGEGVEKEADTFAAYLLMPLHDFRARIHPDAKPTIDDLSDCAIRYGVSLTAAVLRWLEYTNRRSLFIVSNDDYAIWAKASGPAFRSGRFIRTRNTMYELPPASLVRTRPDDLDMKVGVKQPAGVWFDEPAEEMCVTSTRHELDMTLLHLGTDSARTWHQDADAADVFDRMS